MSTPTSDYNQQLFAYLQAWRQLLEQWTAMAAATAGLPFSNAPFGMPTAPFMPPGGQFMPPALPFMPPLMPPPTAPVAPTPPAPADYTQQLFSYLSAWRQYLEQMTGAAPVPPQAPAAQQAAEAAEAADGGGAAQNMRPPDMPIPPDTDTGSRGPGDTARTETNPTWPPRLVDVEPGSYFGSQIATLNFDPTAAGPFERGPGAPEVLSPPEYDFGYQFDGPRRRTTVGPAAASVGPVHMAQEAATQLPVTGTPFRSTIERAQALGRVGEAGEAP